MPPTFNGEYLFGACSRIAHNPMTAAHQVAAFLGVEGVLSAYAGTRGRTFECSGLFTGSSREECVLMEDAWMTYVGAPRASVLVDTFGRAWADVEFRGEIRCGPGGPRYGVTAGSGPCWAWPYKLILQGLA